MTSTHVDLLDEVLSGQRQHFALINRSSPTTAGIELHVGTPRTISRLSELEPANGQRLIALIPYRMGAEVGHEVVDDATPLRALDISATQIIEQAEVERLRSSTEDEAYVMIDGFHPNDADFADRVSTLQKEEIVAGNGANFVLSRTARGRLSGSSTRDLIGLFQRLLERERGAYWTFLVVTGNTALLGASPERHVSLRNGVAEMTPISATIRIPEEGVSPESMRAFLSDEKEISELSMVLDEELKMMSELCEDRVTISGPSLRMMSQVAHTEYELSGHTNKSLTRALQSTLFAPTVTGGPVRSACSVISRYEPEGRGYYSGIIADLRGATHETAAELDSAILIRTGHIDRVAHSMDLRVGATIVRDSDPVSEAAETRHKAEGLAQALGSVSPRRFTEVQAPIPGPIGVAELINQRRQRLSRWWLGGGLEGAPLGGVSTLILDGEDSFTQMIASILRNAGGRALVRPAALTPPIHGHDLVVVGPGPGDPRDLSDPRVVGMHNTITRCLESATPFVAVCLGYQVLCDHLGIPLRPLSVPHQGTQLDIEFMGRTETCGFYNSFTAHLPHDVFLSPRARGAVHVHRFPESDSIHTVTGQGFVGVQFHPESVLTRNGAAILIELCQTSLGDTVSPHLETGLRA